MGFDASGAVRGRGVDGEDGPYTITKGVWGQRAGDKEGEGSVGWIEQYSEGFEVVVEGFYNAKNGKIEARFRSSRGVSGRFMLAPKPSILSEARPDGSLADAREASAAQVGHALAIAPPIPL